MDKELAERGFIRDNGAQIRSNFFGAKVDEPVQGHASDHAICKEV